MAIHELTVTGTLGPVQATSTDGMLGFAGAVVKLNILTTITLGDDGGWELILSGVFPMNHSYFVDILRSGEDFEAQRCYSGKIGNRDRCVPANVSSLVCYLPPLPIGDGYDIRVKSTGGVLQDIELDCLDIVHRSFATNLYTLRSHFPPPRDVGAYDVDEEE
jgi:hypothetical protein